MTVIPSGIDPVFVRPDPEAIEAYRVARGLPRRFVLAVGTREPRKNIPALIRAWDVLSRTIPDEIGLVCAGPAGWLEGDITAQRRTVRYPERIMLCGDVPQGEMPLLMSAADVLAYPSLLEGFGFPPLEAMSCGTPVIASANSSIAEMCGDAALLVDPYAVRSIADGLRAVLTDAAVRDRLVHKGMVRARRFSWERAATATLEAITGIRSA